MFYDRGNHYEFLSLGQELAAPGDLQHPQTFPFNFKNVEKQYESYNGINVKLRYFTRVTVSRRMADVIREKDIWVYSYRIPPEINSSIKMDVGIEDCLHIEFEYSKSKYHLKDVIVGRIYFLLVRLKIKHMELSIIRRETTGVAPNQYNESETLVRFEIMDGSPSRGETIPIRLFLGGFDLTPTFREVNKKYSVRYYLSLVLIDEGTSLSVPSPRVIGRISYPQSRSLPASKHEEQLAFHFGQDCELSCVRSLVFPGLPCLSLTGMAAKCLYSPTIRNGPSPHLTIWNARNVCADLRKQMLAGTSSNQRSFSSDKRRKMRLI
jgi:hypothetical protein